MNFLVDSLAGRQIKRTEKAPPTNFSLCFCFLSTAPKKKRRPGKRDSTFPGGEGVVSVCVCCGGGGGKQAIVK